jgi:hypothetical protein
MTTVTCNWDCLIIMYISPLLPPILLYLNLKQASIQGRWVKMHTFLLPTREAYAVLISSPFSGIHQKKIKNKFDPSKN